MDTGAPQDPEHADAGDAAPPPDAPPPPPPPGDAPPPPPADGPPPPPPVTPPPAEGVVPPPPPPGGIPMDLGQPGGAAPEEAAPKKSFKALWIAGGAVVLVLLVAVVLISVLGGDSVSVPDQIDGVSRITSGPLAGVMDKQVNSSGLKGTNAVGGLYGTPTSPEFLFIAAEGSESDSEDKAALQAAASSLGSGGALSLDTSSVTKEEVDGITYNCAPVTGSGLSGSACLWNGSGTLGMVLWFQDRGDPVTFASDVHDAVVS